MERGRSRFREDKVGINQDAEAVEEPLTQMESHSQGKTIQLLGRHAQIVAAIITSQECAMTSGNQSSIVISRQEQDQPTLGATMRKNMTT